MPTLELTVRRSRLARLLVVVAGVLGLVALLLTARDHSRLAAAAAPLLAAAVSRLWRQPCVGGRLYCGRSGWSWAAPGCAPLPLEFTGPPVCLPLAVQLCWRHPGRPGRHSLWLLPDSAGRQELWRLRRHLRLAG